jgi:hypothetical protein
MTPRCRPLLLLPALLLLGCPTACTSVHAPEDRAHVARPDWNAADHHRQATDLLRQGKDYSRAIAHAREAVRQQPENREYQRALGAACASRAASLAYAYQWTYGLEQARKDYPEELAEWQAKKAEAEQNGETFLDSPPDQPPVGLVLKTKDDGKPFTLSAQQVEKEVVRLSVDALQAFGRAVALSTTPPEKADAQYQRGWALLLLRYHLASLDQIKAQKQGMDVRFKSEDDLPSPVRDEVVREAKSGPITVSAARQAFEEATRWAPDSARYWESLGCALHGFYPDDGRGLLVEALAQKDDAANAAWLAALERDPSNAALWYKVAERTERQRARRYFQKAAEADPTNAAPLYRMAALDFEDAPYQNLYQARTRKSYDAAPGRVAEREARSPAAQKAAQQALEAVLRGNGRAVYRYPYYRPPVPELLAGAWDNCTTPSFNFPSQNSSMRALARNLCGYAYSLAEQGNQTAAERVLQADLEVAAKMMADWPLRDITRGGFELITHMTGFAVAITAHDARRDIYLKAGDVPSLKSVMHLVC